MSEIFLYNDKEVMGVSNWWWDTQDIQTFDIIKRDWEKSHHAKLMKYMSQYEKQFHTVVQAGGNCGMYPRLLSHLFKWVYTFEPDPSNFVALTLNCNMNNVFKTQAALGAAAGSVSMVHRSPINVGMHQVRESEESSIPLLPLDSFSFKSLDLLWLDIEDYEYNAFQGAVNTILKHKPLVMCENPTKQVQDYLYDAVNYEMIDQSGMDGIFYYR